MTFSSFSARASSALLAAALTVLPAAAQQPELLTAKAQPVTAKRGQPFTAKVVATLRPGLHCNSNQPKDELLIPLKLTVEKESGYNLVKVAYPPAKLEKYSFSDQPLSVYSGEFVLEATLQSVSASPGLALVPAKLRFQACSDSMCFPPKTIAVKIPVDLR